MGLVELGTIDPTARLFVMREEICPELRLSCSLLRLGGILNILAGLLVVRPIAAFSVFTLRLDG